MNERDVLLIYPGYTYPRKNPPLGLAYLAAALRRSGYLPRIVDLNVEDHTGDELGALVRELEPLAVGISFMTNQYGESLRLAEAVRSASPSTRIVVGGPHVSALPRETLRECPAADFAVVGEGEETFPQLLDSLASGDPRMDRIAGICYRRGKECVRTRPRAPIADVDRLPFPAWDLLEPEKYSVFSVGKGRAFALLSSRGCPGRCTFCDSHTVFGRTFRPRSARAIFSEIESLHAGYGMLEFDFVDDMITLKKDRVFELCRLIEGSGIPFRWMANSRVNTLSREMLEAMKRSGCVRIDVGVESGDPAVRRLARKGTTNEQIIRVHEWARELGLQIGAFAMVGNLGESMESVKMTARLLKDIGQDVMISIACPFPGTELYRVAKEKGYLRVTDWSRYVTSPTYLKDYEPVMVTDTMDRKRILDAYYFLHSFFFLRKFRARYGSCFPLNPLFLRDWLLKSAAQGELLRKAAMLMNILRSRLLPASNG